MGEYGGIDDFGLSCFYIEGLVQILKKKPLLEGVRFFKLQVKFQFDNLGVAYIPKFGVPGPPGM